MKHLKNQLFSSLKSLKSSNPVIKDYLALSFLIMFGNSFNCATYIPFLISHGMNLWQINLINSFFMATFILMEMPTGSFADKFGRPRSISISCFLMGIGALVYFLSNNFWLFVLAEITIGIGRTFVSGALDAWLVDSLIAQGNLHLKEKIFRQESYLNSAGAIIGSISGAYIGSFNLAWPWLVGASIAAISGFYSLKLKESYKLKSANQISGAEKTERSLSEQIKLAWKHGFNNRDLLTLMALSAVLAASVQALNMQWTVIFQKNYNLGTQYLGWIYAAIALTAALGGRLSKHSRSIAKNGKKFLIVIQIITALIIIIMTQITGLAITLSFFLLHQVTRGAFGPIRKTLLNDQIVSGVRATILSLDSMINKIGCLIGLLASGFLASAFSIKIAWLISGIFLLVSASLFLIPRRLANSKTDFN